MDFDSEKQIKATITDIKMPFMSMVVFMIKWTIASVILPFLTLAKNRISVV